MRGREEITTAAKGFAERLLGLDYSRTYRYRWYKGGSTDCSGYVYAAYLAAGYPLLMDGVERMTSMYEVYADGFELMYPSSYAVIGRELAPESFYRDFAWQAGDLIFYNFDKETARSNRITHVAMCYDENHIIHTANNREKACIKDISYGYKDIAAVIRLKSGAEEMERIQIKKGAGEKIQVRRMQALLNLSGAFLNCDGIWGSRTEEALRAFQAAKGLEADGICGKRTWAALLGEAAEEDKPEEKPASQGYAFYRNMKKGIKGEDVRELQKMLNRSGFAAGSEDGIFGSKTLSAVKAAQRAYGLTVDGIAGKKTVTALGGRWGAAVSEKPAGEVTVCTFNIKRGTYKNGTHKIMADIVKDADIIGIQEVTLSGLDNIAGYAGKKGYMCETISGYGHAVLTDCGVSSAEIITLPGSGERRKVHHMMMGDVSFYNTHFHYTEPANTKQLEALTGILAKDQSSVIIVTGDFNRQDLDAIESLGFKQANTGQAIAATEGSASIVNKIDNIFVKGAEITDIWKYNAVKKNESDHDALFVKVKI